MVGPEPTPTHVRTDAPTTDADFELARSIRRGTASLATRMRYERAGVLTQTETAALGILYRLGTLTPGEMAEKMGTQPQSLTRTLASLEHDGLITRTPDPSDGRQSMIAPTVAGRRALADEMRPRDEWLTRAIAQTLTESERDLLVVAARLMERVATVAVTGAPRSEPSPHTPASSGSGQQ